MRNKKDVILVVEGRESVRQEYRRFLQKKRYEIKETADGREALDYLKVNPDTTDLVLISYDIPELSGIELLKILKLSERMKNVPVVLFMEKDCIAERMLAMDNGAEDVFLRPWEERTVANRIENILIAKTKPVCVNIMEEILEKELDKAIDGLHICKCRQCRKDVLTLALNRLKPRYVSSEKGKLISMVDQMSYDYVPEMLRVLTEAAEVVRKNPRHPESSSLPADKS